MTPSPKYPCVHRWGEKSSLLQRSSLQVALVFCLSSLIPISQARSSPDIVFANATAHVTPENRKNVTTVLNGIPLAGSIKACLVTNCWHQTLSCTQDSRCGNALSCASHCQDSACRTRCIASLKGHSEEVNTLFNCGMEHECLPHPKASADVDAINCDEYQTICSSDPQCVKWRKCVVAESQCPTRDFGCIAKCTAVNSYTTDKATGKLGYCSVFLNIPITLSTTKQQASISPSSSSNSSSNSSSSSSSSPSSSHSHHHNEHRPAQLPNTALKPKVARIVFIVGASLLAVILLSMCALCIRHHRRIATETRLSIPINSDWSMFDGSSTITVALQPTDASADYSRIAMNFEEW